MSSILKELSCRVKEVEVAGQLVKVGLPPVIDRGRLIADAVRLTESGGDGQADPLQLAVGMDELTIRALGLCVEDSGMDGDDWGRLLTLSRREDVPGLEGLVTECLKLCGLDVEKALKEEKAEALEPDLADEADESLGELPI